MTRFFLCLLSSIFLTACSLTVSEPIIEGNNDKVYEDIKTQEDPKVKGHVTVTPWELW